MDNHLPFRRLVRVWVLGLTAAAIAACTPLRVGSDFDHTAVFSGFHAFTFMPREHFGTRNPLVVERTRSAIQSELTRRGYVNASDAAPADFAVDFTIGSRERTEITSFPAPYADAYWIYPGWWGAPYWGSEMDVRQYREGTLSIDVYDAHSHKPVWHGWAKKELTRKDLERSEQPIREAVAAVLAKYPPQ